MSNPKTFKGPVTGHVYDLEHGEKIDPLKEGIGADFAQRVSIIENWFNSVLRKPNMVLTFEARELTEQEAIEMESEK